MALALKDRVRETSTTTGTGTLTLAGAPTGFKTFSASIGNGNTCYYAIAHTTLDEWEVGIGTVAAGTLARTTLLSSSTGSAVSFSAGIKDVFCTLPASVAGSYAAAGDNSDITSLSALTSISANQVSYTPTGTGAVATMVQSKLRETASVKDFGAVGDGTTDDTAAIKAALDALVGNQVLLFPAGQYSITAAGGLIDASGLLLTSKSGITIMGYGATLFRADAPTNYNRKPLTVTGCDQFRLIGLSVNNNGNLYFGGLSIYDSKDVVVRDCRFYDSAPGAETSDRYALIYGDNTGTVSNALFTGNSTDGLQWDVYGQEIRIIGNSWIGTPVNRCLGIVTGGNSIVRRGYLVSGNTFMCGKDSAIGMGTDPDTNTGATIENVLINGNTFYSSTAGGDSAITCNAIGGTNTYRNFSIIGNTMYDSGGRPFINFENSNISNWLYSINVQNNVYRSSATVSARPVYRFKRVLEGGISNNSAFGSLIVDAFLFDRVLRLTITGNQAEATGKAYELTNTGSSTTGYQIFRDNTWMGAPTTKLSLPIGINLADIIEIESPDFETVTISGAAQSILAAGRRNIVLTASAASSLDSISNAYYGQILTIFFNNSNVTVSHGTALNKIKLAGGVNFTGTSDDTLVIMYDNAGRWREISRTVI